jgi:MoxR-like ATPase
LMALLARGHVLMEGVPGTGKTLISKSLATCVQCTFRRVQMTPDLMPSDVVGTSVYDQRTGNFGILKGPVFTNILLADEVNRAPAKTQSALLECMGEKQVTIEGRRFPLPGLFLVLATQNPVEQEGTYPLPEAQLDRFMFKVQNTYPTEADEVRILSNMESGFDPQAETPLKAVTDEATIVEAQNVTRSVTMREDVRTYCTKIARMTREHALVSLGAGPRATVDMYLASKAAAVLAGRDYVTPDDVKKVSRPVLRHRLFLKPQAELEWRTADQVLNDILSKVKVPR